MAALDACIKISAEERAWAYHLSMDRAEADYRNYYIPRRREGGILGFLVVRNAD